MTSIDHLDILLIATCESYDLFIRHRIIDINDKKVSPVQVSQWNSRLTGIEKQGNIAVFKIPPMLITTKTARGRFPKENIVRCLAESNYCSIYYGTGIRIFISKTLKAVGNGLPSSGFLRVHRSHIVRRDAIHHVQPNFLVMNNGDIIPVSRRYKKAVSQRLADNTVCN